MAEDKNDDKKSAESGGGDKGKDQIDPKIAEIMKDPDAVKSLLDAKRAANDEAKSYRLKLEKLEADKKSAEDKALQEQGKYKELAEKTKADLDKATERYGRATINAALKVAALQAGITDPADAVALCDREKLKVAEDGETVEGAAEAVAGLKKGKPYLFGNASKGDDGGDDKSKLPADDKKAALRGVLDKNPAGSMKPVDRIAAGLGAASKKK